MVGGGTHQPKLSTLTYIVVQFYSRTIRKRKKRECLGKNAKLHIRENNQILIRFDNSNTSCQKAMEVPIHYMLVKKILAKNFISTR